MTDKTILETVKIDEVNLLDDDQNVDTTTITGHTNITENHTIILPTKILPEATDYILQAKTITTDPKSVELEWVQNIAAIDGEDGAQGTQGILKE